MISAITARRGSALLDLLLGLLAIAGVVAHLEGILGCEAAVEHHCGQLVKVSFSLSSEVAVSFNWPVWSRDARPRLISWHARPTWTSELRCRCFPLADRCCSLRCFLCLLFSSQIRLASLAQPYLRSIHCYWSYCSAKLHRFVRENDQLLILIDFPFSFCHCFAAQHQEQN